MPCPLNNSNLLNMPSVHNTMPYEAVKCPTPLPIYFLLNAPSVQNTMPYGALNCTQYILKVW
jgi:hypothetical protein